MCRQYWGAQIFESDFLQIRAVFFAVCPKAHKKKIEKKMREYQPKSCVPNYWRHTLRHVMPVSLFWLIVIKIKNRHTTHGGCFREVRPCKALQQKSCVFLCRFLGLQI
jgi:hypothetical protein